MRDLPELVSQTKCEKNIVIACLRRLPVSKHCLRGNFMVVPRELECLPRHKLALSNVRFLRESGLRMDAPQFPFF
jgi:hypothetical protein